MEQYYKLKLIGVHCVTFMVLSAITIHAQSSSYFDEEQFLGSVGISGSYGLQSHSLNFKGLPEVPSCCPQYSGGNGIGFSLGGVYDFSIGSFLRVDIRGAFSTIGGTFKANETKLVFDGKNSVDGLFEHTIESNIHKIDMTPSLQISIYKGLKIHTGLSAGWIIGTTYDQQERLVTPTDLLFENDSRTRLRSSGSISTINTFQVGAIAQLSYDLPLNANASLVAAPEVSYTIGLSNILRDSPWKVNSLNIGMVLKYAWYKYPERIEPTIDKIPMLPKPTVPMEITKRPVVTGTARGVFIDNMGNPTKEQILNIKNITSTNVTALVNYVFFDDTSAVIPKRYILLNKEQAKIFRLKDLEGTGTLPIYYTILNVIGNRMTMFPEATITLTGCTSGGETEKDKLQLAKQRADAVKNYLTEIWGIDSKRIIPKYRDLPEFPSNIKIEDGLAENRRVEISSNSWEILDVLSFNDTVRQISVPIIGIEAQATAESGIAQWTISASQGNNQLKKFKGTSDFPSDRLRWDLVKESHSVPKMNEPIDLTMDITDKEGNTTVIKGEPMKITQFYDQKGHIEIFSLIIFGFNVSTVNETNQRILAMIKSRITKNSIVKIIGFTDRIGAADYNQKLSDRRAKEIGKFLKLSEDNSEGKGGSDLLFDNDLPEGRFYCRTVRVIVETPIE
jgi:outer membrane protein OmpA-like peptidoglycan-associated protein